MANRHKRGGGVRSTPEAGGNPKVFAEAKARKDGGRAEYKAGGEVACGRMDKRARGGGVGSTPVSYGNPKVVSEAREKGGSGSGADRSPMSSAGGGKATSSPFSSARR